MKPKGKANAAWPKENNVRHSQLLPTVRTLVAVVVALLPVVAVVFLGVFGVLVFFGKKCKRLQPKWFPVSSRRFALKRPLFCLSAESDCGRGRVGIRQLKAFERDIYFYLHIKLIFKFDSVTAKLRPPEADSLVQVTQSINF